MIDMKKMRVGEMAIVLMEDGTEEYAFVDKNNEGQQIWVDAVTKEIITAPITSWKTVKNF